MLGMLDMLEVKSPFAAGLSVLLGVHGLRSGSLSLSGAFAAIVAGDLTLGLPDLRLFGVLLIAFYLAGSRATKVKADYKATLEESHAATLAPSGKQVKAGGNRNAIQVLCNCWLGTAAAVLWQFACSEPDKWSTEQWCVLGGGKSGLSTPCIIAAVSFFAACAGDTFASELGILSKSEPVLVTTWKKVPRGTNGGITAWGTFVSLLGGLFIALVAIVDLAIENPTCSLKQTVPLLLGVGGASGLLGSLVDSILGATMQASYYSESKKKIVARAGKDTKRVAGTDVLSNNAVNFLSSGLVALSFAWLLR